MPPIASMPKYAAVNLAGSPCGALYEKYVEQTPAHFVFDDQVIRNRTTFLSGDSLQQSNPAGALHETLRGQERSATAASLAMTSPRP